MKKTFIIEYSVFDKNGKILKNGKIKVKNKANSLEAQCMLDKFLEKRYKNFGRLIVHDCKEEDSINSVFGNIFG